MTPHIIIKIETCNDTFKDNANEISRILRDIANQLDNKAKGEYIEVSDSDGNHVGELQYYGVA